jgi:hypothetical protein
MASELFSAKMAGSLFKKELLLHSSIYQDTHGITTRYELTSIR